MYWYFSQSIKNTKMGIFKHCNLRLSYENQQLVNICAYIISIDMACLLQCDQLYMAVSFWYPVKSDLSSATCVQKHILTSHFLQGTEETRPCSSGRVVWVHWYGTMTMRTERSIFAMFSSQLVARDWSVRVRCSDIRERASTRVTNTFVFYFIFHEKK